MLTAHVIAAAVIIPSEPRLRQPDLWNLFHTIQKPSLQPHVTLCCGPRFDERDEISAVCLVSFWICASSYKSSLV